MEIISFENSILSAGVIYN